MKRLLFLLLLPLLCAWPSINMGGGVAAVGVEANTFTFDSGDQYNNSTFIHITPLYRLSAVANATATFEAELVAARADKRIIVMQYRPGSAENVTKDISGTRKKNGTGSAIITQSFSTTGTDGVVCGMAAIYNSGTWSAQTINSVSADDARSEVSATTWCRILTAALTTVTGASTFSTGDSWAATAIAFKADAGGDPFTFVASASGKSDGSSTTVATSSTLNVANGDLLIALVTYETGTATTVSITDQP